MIQKYNASKRLLSILLAIVMCLMMLPITALAAEDTTSTITGVSITVDGTEYTEGNVTITPDSEVTITVTGANLQNGTDDNYVEYAAGMGISFAQGYFEINDDGTTATYTVPTGFFVNCNNFEITYYNNYTANRTKVPTGIYLTYDAGSSEEDKAVITGVSIKVGETVYTSGTVTLTPESGDVTFIVTGTNLQNATFDNMVLFKSGYSRPMDGTYAWSVNETGTEASYTFSIAEFASQTTAYEIKYSNDDGQSLKNTGVYVIYNDGTGGEEDTTTAQFTGVTVTVDGVPYTSGNVTITHTSTVVYTVTGTNFANLTSDHYLMIAPDTYVSRNNAHWAVDAAANTVTVDLSEQVHFLEACDNFEVKYSNDGRRTWIGTGIYLTYHDDTKQLLLKAVDTDGNVIDGTLDAILYTGETMVGWIANTSEGYDKWYVSVGENTITDWDYCPAGYVKPTEAITFTADADGNITITSNNATLEVTDTVAYIVVTLTAEGDGEDTTPAEITGVSITVDGKTYTEGNVTITPTSTVIITVTGTNFANVSDDNLLMYAPGYADSLKRVWFTIDAEANTATWDASEGIDLFANCDNSEVMYSNDGSTNYIGSGIYLTYDAGISEEDKAVITGVSITVDGVTYNSGNVTITPTSTIVYTVTGINFANVSEDNVLIYAGPYGDFLNNGWPIDAEANTATFDASEDIDLFAICDNFEVIYSNDGGLTYTGTGIYLTFVKPAPDSTGKIVVDMTDYYGDGWDGAAIEVYKNGSLETTATVDQKSNTVSLNYDSAASYEFKWVEGELDAECIFTIYVDGELMVKHYGAAALADGETLLTLGDVTTEPAVITGVSIMVGGTTYTEGTVTLTPDSGDVTIIVSGTNLQNRTNNNKVKHNSVTSLAMGSGSAWSVNDTGTEARRTVAITNFESETTAHEIGYCNDGSTNYIGSGVYVIYDNGIAEEDKAVITDVSIKVGETVYTSGTVTLTPDSGDVTIIVSGTNLQNRTNDNRVSLRTDLSMLMGSGYAWSVNDTGTEASRTYSVSDFANQTTAHEIGYCNDGSTNFIGTGIYLTYDDGIAEEDRAVITGVSITVDGETYSSGEVIITPTSTIVYTVYGTNFANVSVDNLLMYAPGYADSLNRVWFTIDAEANTATYDASEDIDLFAICDNFEVIYSNDGQQSWQGTGIYLTYNDGTGESELISVNITWSEMSFTYTDGEWQPESHTYADGKWTPDNENGNVITVQNNGNVAVNVTFAYDKTVSEVEGSFTDESGSAITSPFALAVEEVKKIKLILNGKPSSTFENAPLGSVTVKITLPEQQDP